MMFTAVLQLSMKKWKINQSLHTLLDALTEQVLEDLMEVKGYNETQAYNLLYSGGLSIYTTQDPDIQAICDDVFGNEENYPADTKWYLNYALTVKKANGEKENHSSEMFKSYFKQTNSSFNMLYPSKEDAQAAIDAYKAAVMSEGDTVEGEKITLTPQPQVSITIEDQATGYIRCHGRWSWTEGSKPYSEQSLHYYQTAGFYF